MLSYRIFLAFLFCGFFFSAHAQVGVPSKITIKVVPVFGQPCIAEESPLRTCTVEFRRPLSIYPTNNREIDVFFSVTPSAGYKLSFSRLGPTFGSPPLPSVKFAQGADRAYVVLIPRLTSVNEGTRYVTFQLQPSPTNSYIILRPDKASVKIVD